MVFGQSGLQNKTSKLPFILISTDNKQRERRKDIVKVAAGEEKKNNFCKDSEKMTTGIISDRVYLSWLLTEE